MWPLAMYSNRFEIVSTVAFSSLTNQTNLGFVCVSLYTINNDYDNICSAWF